jgi:hypothetical protein
MNNKDKIYIAGCGEMLGEAFYEVFKNVFSITVVIIYNLQVNIPDRGLQFIFPL